ncbi:MAG: SDR family NAD(P)-dependent oxidoreductase [Myxococcales bacterium]
MSSGRRALVTGASSGIGEAYARRLAKDGNDLVLVARRAEKLASLAQELERAHGVKVEAVSADLSTDEGMEAAEKVIDAGPLDWLVSSAGFATRGHLVSVAPEKIARQVRLHVEANARMVRRVLPGMVERKRGSLVVVSSLSAFLTTEHYVTYSASKAYLNMFVLGLRDELRGTGVRAQALCPGLTKTEFMFTEEYKDFSYDSVPAWVWMSAEEVVDESVQALERAEKEPVFVPGRGNRAFVKVMETPLVGTAVRAAISRLGRGKNLY